MKSATGHQRLLYRSTVQLPMEHRDTVPDAATGHQRLLYRSTVQLPMEHRDTAPDANTNTSAFPSEKTGPQSFLESDSS
jgi:hypothetical protein